MYCKGVAASSVSHSVNVHVEVAFTWSDEYPNRVFLVGGCWSSSVLDSFPTDVFLTIFLFVTLGLVSWSYRTRQSMDMDIWLIAS
jgi:hypothetical protein